MNGNFGLNEDKRLFEEYLDRWIRVARNPNESYAGVLHKIDEGSGLLLPYLGLYYDEERGINLWKIHENEGESPLHLTVPLIGSTIIPSSREEVENHAERNN